MSMGTSPDPKRQGERRGGILALTGGVALALMGRGGAAAPDLAAPEHQWGGVALDPILAAHCSMERTMRALLDGLKNRLRAKEDELGRKSLEMEGLTRSLREAKAENKHIQAELDKGSEAKAEIDRLKAELEKERGHSTTLTDYYNLMEPKIEALRQDANRAEAKAQRLARDVAEATKSAKTACRTLRLALTDMGAKARGVPGESASALEFSEWTQQAGCANCATAYGDCCARVSAAFTLGLLQQSGCEHIAQFPDFAKMDWEKDGRSAAKARLLEQLAKTEAADQGEEPAEEGGGDAQDHPEATARRNR
uniref:Uncharacterized protein n=1 Tax=Oryza punctata TaxID=4537 RepID=A0A0E0JHZ8_ORYPU